MLIITLAYCGAWALVFGGLTALLFKVLDIVEARRDDRRF